MAGCTCKLFYPNRDPLCPLHVGVRQWSAGEPSPATALQVQVGGGHYKGLKIQPIEYIHANGIPFAEGSAIKYLTRWREKGGIEDLKKARHFIDLLIELETKAAGGAAVPGAV